MVLLSKLTFNALRLKWVSPGSYFIGFLIVLIVNSIEYPTNTLFY